METIEDDFIKIIQILNNAPVMVNGKKITGSLIDLDFVHNCREIDKDFKLTIDNGHKLIKKTFFNLLNEDFLESLNPVCEE